jgi:hypothetical protein
VFTGSQFNLCGISLCGLMRRSYTLTTNSNASGSSDIGGIYRIKQSKVGLVQSGPHHHFIEN